VYMHIWDASKSHLAQHIFLSQRRSCERSPWVATSPGIA
jgi:hypothetical protein